MSANPLVIPRVCLHCGASFMASASQVNRGGALYCSVKCGAAKRSKPIECNCATCGKTFIRGSSNVRKGTCNAYCSKACRDRRIALTCETCNKTFYRKRGERPAKHNYCSMVCRRRAVKCVCFNCGMVVTRKPSVLHRKVFCSFRCRDLYSRGPRSSRWRGGGKLYYGPDWSEAKKAARKRAGYKCQRCGVSQSELARALDVHHKIPVRCFANANDAHYPENLITLCGSCHRIAETEGSKAAPLLDLLSR